MNYTTRARAFATCSIAALLLAACGSSDTVEAENESVGSVAEKVAKSDIKPNPGKFRCRPSSCRECRPKCRK